MLLPAQSGLPLVQQEEVHAERQRDDAEEHHHHAAEVETEGLLRGRLLLAVGVVCGEEGVPHHRPAVEFVEVLVLDRGQFSVEVLAEGLGVGVNQRRPVVVSAPQSAGVLALHPRLLGGVPRGEGMVGREGILGDSVGRPHQGQ
jgi:hypothetical protein